MTQDMVLQALGMLQQGIIECITIGGMDIAYDAQDGAWHICHHTPYTAYDDIYECSGVVLALVQ